MEEQNAKKNSPKALEHFFKHWSEMNIFERFEYLVLQFVNVLLLVIVFVALIRLTENVFHLVVSEITHTSEFKTFQVVFGMLLTLLITFEFKNSINAILERQGLLVQVKIIILIALIALARKFLVIDPKEFSPGIIAAYAAVTVGLGVVYWLLCNRQAEEQKAKNFI